MAGLMRDKINGLLLNENYSPLKGLDKMNMMSLLENTGSAQSGKIIGEETLSGDIAKFTPIMMPIVRRVYPALIANEILGVQPMTSPTGFIYALTNRYTGSHDNKISLTAKGQILHHAAEYAGAIGDTVTGVDASGAAVTGEVVFISKDKFDVLVRLTDPEKKFVADGATITAVYSNESTFGKILPDYSGAYLTADGEKLATDMSEVGFSIDRVSIEAVTRKLKSEYTLEMYDDLMAQHGLNAEEELISLISNEMQIELDREILKFVNGLAKVGSDTAAWYGVGGSDMIANTITAGRAMSEIEAYRSLAMRIDLEARDIAVRNKRGAANVIICSPKVVTMLAQLGKFVIAPKDNNLEFDLNNGVVGTYDGRFKVICDQFATDDYITLLYKGTNVQDSIGWFCPYVPLSFQKVVNPDSGQPGIIARTRYALAAHPQNPEYFATTFGVNFDGTILGAL